MAASHKVLISVKIDKNLKESLQPFINETGMSLSFLVNNALRGIARERKVVVEQYPIPYTLRPEVAREIDRLEEEYLADPAGTSMRMTSQELANFLGV
jgi:antitoxin component of RelBE/YafQ-DinJ toxin-antitoxin module